MVFQSGILHHNILCGPNQLGILVVVLVWSLMSILITEPLPLSFQQQLQPALCLEPKVTGDCNATMTRYFYNTQTGLCGQFGRTLAVKGMETTSKI